MTSPEVLGRALAAAPDPDLARVALSRVGEDPVARELLADPGVLGAALRLLGFSSAVTDFLVAHPEEAALFAELHPRDRAALSVEVTADIDRHGPEAGLRRFRRRALFRVAARDLGGAPFEEVVTEVSAIAEACLEGAVAAAGGGLAVIGMGKLGGGELNYASDVDVLFVHRQGGAEAQAEAGGRAARAIALLSEATAEGVALRVDASLRPEGRAGALSRSLSATSDYYRRHAATWEKQALLKARPVAGDMPLGALLLDELAPVVYPEHLEPSAIEDVRQMKVRIEEYVRARGKEATEVKRGRGGIRDVEFAVQLLQLVHGRRDSRLREPNTLRALAALGEQGYVATADADALAGSYRFLRTLEHRLQLARDVQTHELPGDEPSRRRVARSMGLADGDALAADYRRHTRVVRGLHERLFYRPMLEAFAGPAVPRPGTDREATVELLAGFGLRDPDAAYRRLDRLVDPGDRLGRVLQHLFPVTAPALALSPDPDAALVRFERVIEALRADAHAPDRLASNPEVARRLALTVGASSWLSDLLVARPEAVAALGGQADGDAPADLLVAVGAAYAAGQLAVPESGRALTRVADAVVSEAVADAAPTLPFAVIGLGKLGGQELNFASDLDVVFVYEGEGPQAFAEAERAATAVLAGIRDRGFEADPDLRPEGRSGPLARSLAAYLEYWERWGQTWEFQSLLKTRFVAGQEELGRRLVGAAGDFAYPELLPVEREAEVRRMRVRMEQERVRPPDARRFHFKLGYGGLADVSFAVELSQMRHGVHRPELRRRHTLEALEALSRERLVEDSVSLALGEAYVFLSEVKNAMEIDRRVHAEAIPPSPEAQLALARLLGYEEYPRQRFLEDYRRVTRRARRAMERVFYGEEG
ncbi:MAG: bifunctional [glutamine synthetase] adenylyltransferase/[glutamine synthetase]-adenylyl-L-tyrosine phosphorylase [Actinomycetota bacterium]